ncbi:hypothetical protein BFJ65_g8013 [Fusarium oxysporum f. sp. cepae]|uniref:Uncharacterized protein n=1 Tax=Fusarium oxysporum f. sp. cepae TaxID=396571 RepID=A0A3L6NIZ1_FUSOX|nr:hypothetical protein BFJ65_g8013 [Fusarium oxysporum f. sp. cepae]
MKLSCLLCVSMSASAGSLTAGERCTATRQPQFSSALWLLDRML